MRFWITRAMPSAIVALVATLLAASSARALPTVRKYPVGPWVTNDAGVYSVPAGQPIDWLVRVCNDTAAPLTAQVSDFLHSGDCLNHEYLTLSCPPVQDAGGTLASCDDQGLGMLDVSGIVIPVNTCAEVIIRTGVDLLTPRAIPGGLCNIAFYQTDSGTPDGSGQTSPPVGNSGCTCVEVAAPLPTQLDFTLLAIPDTPPLLAGDATSTLVYELRAENLTPREVRGTVLFPIPAGLDFLGFLDCPPGSTCNFFAGTAEIQNVVLPEGLGFSGRLRVAPNCDSAANPDLCAQAEFLPIENPGAIVRSDDPVIAGEQPTCVRAAASDLRIEKTWRLASDADGDGLPGVGDRVRYLVRVWNAGDGAGHAVNVVDNLPLGLDGATATIDARGVFDVSRRQGTWALADIGPGSVIDLWLEATIVLASIAPNRARLTTDVGRACSLAVVLSDDPAVTGASDATSVGTPSAELIAEKSWSFTDLNGDGGVNAFEPVHWLIEIRNDGQAAALDARLDDALAACWSDLGALSVEPPDGGVNVSGPRAIAVTGLGGSDGLLPDETVRVRFTLSASDITSCCNSATITWAAGARTAVSKNPGALASAAGDSCLGSAEPAVSLSKSVVLLDSNGNGLAEPGERLRYTLSAGSHGAGLADVILVDEFPVGFTPDPASIATVPVGLGVNLLPPAAGLHGWGRLEVPGVGLSGAGSLSVVIEGVIDSRGATPGLLCNVASLVVPGQLAPFLSDDSDGGASCVDVVVLAAPSLSVSVSAAPQSPVGCLLPGEDVAVVVDHAVSVGGASAQDVEIRLSLPPGVTVVDADGGSESPGLITWSLGEIPAGATDSFTVIASLACGPASTESFTVSMEADNAAAVGAGPASVSTAIPGLAALIDVFHDDANADGDADPGEVLTAKLTITETLGCDAGEVAVTLDVGPLLDILAVGDGGVATGSEVDWLIPALPALGNLSVTVDLALSALAPDCAQPMLSAVLTWALAAPVCLDPQTLTLPDAPTPPGHCPAADPVDLLREDAVNDLVPLAPGLASLLDSAGVDATCNAATTTRVAPTRIHAADVAASLATGVVVLNDALVVGAGNPGNLVFYEVSHSCEVVRVCRTDADGDTGNGRESVLVTTGICP